VGPLDVGEGASDRGSFDVAGGASTCIHRPASLSVSPATSGPVLHDTTVHYVVSIVNNDVGSCPGAYYVPTLGVEGADPLDGPDEGIAVTTSPSLVPHVLPGQSATFGFDITGTEVADPGSRTIPLTFNDGSVFGGKPFDPPLSGSLIFDLVAPPGCHVATPRELMIRDLSVVEDPVRTSFDGNAGNPHAGVWTFGRIMRDMAKTPGDAPAFTEALFRSRLTDQTVNGFTVPAHPHQADEVLDHWPRLADGSLDLDHAPLRLLAIVNRIDMRDLSRGDAGEGRFVFGVNPPGEDPFFFPFTVIVEYALPAKTECDILGWANAWHDLATHPFPSEEYNAALEALTLRFSGRGAAPDRPNGSALDQLRMDEFGGHWQFRQFGISASTGGLEPRTINLTPDLSFNGSAALGRFINANEGAILADQHVVQLQFEGAPFLGGSVFNDLVRWTAPGIQNSEARFHFSLNTCNGCHGPETNTTFVQVAPRELGFLATLSPFLLGTTVLDPVTGESRSFNDLERRRVDLEGLVCPPSPTRDASAHAPTVAKGISRVH
jgi:hypothetical protein